MDVFLRPRVVLIGALLAVAIVFLSNAPTIKPDNSIVDVSWPNCSARPSRVFEMGIVGVTGGLNFRPNLCLGLESSWFLRAAAYMNTAFPGVQYARAYQSAPLFCRTAEPACVAYDYGYRAADYALRYAAMQGVHSSAWWLDVETENSWTTDLAANQASLKGAIAAIRQEEFYAVVGFYSTPNQWQAITGGWQNGLPAWVGTGLLAASAATPACEQKSFTGGPVWLSQYTNGLDKNILCSSAFLQSVDRMHR